MVSIARPHLKQSFKKRMETWDRAQLEECLLSKEKLWARSPAWNRLGLVAHRWNLSTQEIRGGGGSEIDGHPQLRGAFTASLGYMS